MRMRAGRVTAHRLEPDANPRLELSTYKLLVGSLFASPTSLILSNIIGTLVPIFCWSATGNDLFLSFGVAAVVIVALRVATVIRYHRADHSADSLSQVRCWDREYFAGATIFSVILGVNCFIALAMTSSVPAHLITVVSAIAFSSGYVARNAGRPKFVLVQLLCFCVPMAAGFFVNDEFYYNIIGVFILLYVLTNIVITFSINRNLLALAAATKQSSTLAETLRRKNVTLDTALNSMTHGLAMFDANLQLEICNSKFNELFIISPEASAPGTHFREILNQLITVGTIAPAPANELGATCRRVIDTQQAATFEITNEMQRTFIISFEPTTDSGILMLTEDATVRKATAAQIERMAQYDSLTGLANRYKFNNDLKNAYGDIANGGRRFCVFYVDIDNFKSINDSLGHEAGDELLVKTADRLKEIVGRNGLVARFGGDEFVILYRTPNTQSAMRIGQRIVESMVAPFHIHSGMLYATASMGVAVAPAHGAGPTELLRAADIALYSAKTTGRNNATLFEPAMAEALIRRREIESDLREACQNGGLFLNYQPIVDVKSSEIIACEALLRWKHPTKGMIGPDVFIPIAEQSGLIEQIGDWVIRQACREAASWTKNISVAVNVSAFQFRHTEHLIATVKHALQTSGLAPSRFEIEVTESLLIENEKATLEAIRTLRHVGVRFSLDDFGIGYSSLAYLARYPFSKVKIDRTFAKHVTKEGPSRSIIEAVCQLAHRLGLRVVVEGIETEEQRDQVEKLGAEQAQGYFFGRPEIAANFIKRFIRAA